MWVRSLKLMNFRAHAQSLTEFSPGINLIHGSNGVGKTNLLEALHYVCLSKSFITSSDSYALRKGAAHFEVEAQVALDSDVGRRIRLAYQRGSGKRVFVDGGPLERLSDVVGLVPVVVYSPEDHALTAGGPDERRRLLNNIMSQERPVFMDDLMKYRRALRQRNELLSRSSGGRWAVSQEPVLLSWTAEFITLAARIITARQRFVDSFAGYLQQAYEQLGETVEHPTVRYQTFTDVDGLNQDEVADALRQAVERLSQRELETGRTLIGPHRDDMSFRLDEMDVRRYASQGQHRTFGLALKLGQYLYLHDRRERQPVLLLDDIFGNLDPRRTQVLLRLLQSDVVGQSIITSTHSTPFLSSVAFDQPENRLLEVQGDAKSGSSVRWNDAGERSTTR